MAEGRWYVLGFTSDDVVVASQDSRLAKECVKAGQAAGRPEELGIFQGAGEGDHLIYWFVSEASAALLDAHQVAWRRFLIGERAELPADARAVLAQGQDA